VSPVTQTIPSALLLPYRAGLPASRTLTVGRRSALGPGFRSGSSPAATIIPVALADLAARVLAAVRGAELAVVLAAAAPGRDLDSAGSSGCLSLNRSIVTDAHKLGTRE
jgi:hypothetical protein